MTIRARCVHNDAESMREIVFELEIEVPNGTPLEQAEASARSLLDAVQLKARSWDDDDEEREDWKQTGKPIG